MNPFIIGLKTSFLRVGDSTGDASYLKSTVLKTPRTVCHSIWLKLIIVVFVTTVLLH